MKDLQGRYIDYVRISITDKCNLRCIYCMSENGVSYLPHSFLLSFQEIVRVVECMTQLGVKTVRLTGGEPLARRGCLELVNMLHKIRRVEKVCMTTNGILLKGRMQEAKDAGLDSLNISLDTTDPGIYSKITRGGNVNDVLEAIDEAVDVGFRVEINVVPVCGVNEDDLENIAAFAKTMPVDVRFIELMPVGYGALLGYVSMDTVRRKIEEAFGPMKTDNNKHGAGPAVYYKPEDFIGSIGFIGAISHEFCDGCNRVRITPEGKLKLCLNHSVGLDLREMLRAGAGDNELIEAIKNSIQNKPINHGFSQNISDRETKRMNQIGG